MPTSQAELVLLFQLFGFIVGAVLFVATQVGLRRADNLRLDSIERQIRLSQDECRDELRSVNIQLQAILRDLGQVQGKVGWKRDQ